MEGREHDPSKRPPDRSAGTTASGDVLSTRSGRHLTPVGGTARVLGLAAPCLGGHITAVMLLKQGDTGFAVAIGLPMYL